MSAMRCNRQSVSRRENAPARRALERRHDGSRTRFIRQLRSPTEIPPVPDSTNLFGTKVHLGGV